MDSKNAVIQIFDLISKYGDQKYGEDVTVTSHLVQSGYLAELRGYDQELVVAAFLHDIGHLLPGDDSTETTDMDGFGKMDHERLGGIYLENLGFSERICELVAQHVEAKRYLATNMEYYRKLSRASKETLKFQGGPMSKEEKMEMEENPFFSDILKIRRIDDDAKNEEFTDADIQHFQELVLAYLQDQ